MYSPYIDHVHSLYTLIQTMYSWVESVWMQLYIQTMHVINSLSLDVPKLILHSKTHKKSMLLVLIRSLQQRILSILQNPCTFYEAILGKNIWPSYVWYELLWLVWLKCLGGPSNKVLIFSAMLESSSWVSWAVEEESGKYESVGKGFGVLAEESTLSLLLGGTSKFWGVRI